nr:unnamed protein product [Callosobruchus analis]
MQMFCHVVTKKQPLSEKPLDVCGSTCVTLAVLCIRRNRLQRFLHHSLLPERNLNRRIVNDIIAEGANHMHLDIKKCLIRRYVDDLLLALPTDKIDMLLNTFNSYDVNRQFTVEKEVDSSIPFLDMRIIRSEDNILHTTWYRKPMSSDRSRDSCSNFYLKV